MGSNESIKSTTKTKKKTGAPAVAFAAGGDGVGLDVCGGATLARLS